MELLSSSLHGVPPHNDGSDAVPEQQALRRADTSAIISNGTQEPSAQGRAQQTRELQSLT